MKPFSIVVAFEKNFGIGWQGKLPWHLPGDLKHFKERTTHVHSPGQTNAVIMGRKTWESLPEKFRPLPLRLNVVVTRQKSFCLPPGVMRADAFENALKVLDEIPWDRTVESIFVIGGAQLFVDALRHPGCTSIHATCIQRSFSCDVFFPSIPARFKQSKASPALLENGIEYHFCEYDS